MTVEDFIKSNTNEPGSTLFFEYVFVNEQGLVLNEYDPQIDKNLSALPDQILTTKIIARHFARDFQDWDNMIFWITVAPDNSAQ